MRQLGPLEAQVMDAVWTHGRPASVREVLDALADSHPVAYTTVQSVMENLVGKDFLTRAKDGRAFRYEASVTRESYAAELMADVLSASADRGGTLLRFAEHIPDGDAQALRRALEARDAGPTP